MDLTFLLNRIPNFDPCRNKDINLDQNVFTTSIEHKEFFIKSDVMSIPIDGTGAMALVGTALPFSGLTNAV